MGLSNDSNKLVSHYSGGMRKRLEVATALMPEVKVIILDEPTTGFDPLVRREFLGILKDINQDGTTILLVKHIGEDAEIANIVGFINKGQIIAYGSPEELKQKYSQQNIINIETSIKHIKIIQILQEFNTIGSLLETNVGYKIYCDQPGKIIPLILKKLDTVDCKTTKIEIIPPTLEDVFYFQTKKFLRSLN